MLEGLTRLGGRLLLRISVNGQRRTASLEWDTPPAVSDVELVLLASIGAKVRELRDLELPARSGGSSPTPSPRGPKGRPDRTSHTIDRDGVEA